MQTYTPSHLKELDGFRHLYHFPLPICLGCPSWPSQSQGTIYCVLFHILCSIQGTVRHSPAGRHPLFCQCTTPLCHPQWLWVMVRTAEVFTLPPLIQADSAQTLLRHLDSPRTLLGLCSDFFGWESCQIGMSSLSWVQGLSECPSGQPLVQC